MTSRPRAPSGCYCGAGLPDCQPCRAADIAAVGRARAAEQRLTDIIAGHAVKTWGWPILQDGLRWFSLGQESRDSLVQALPMFDPWCVFSWLPNVQGVPGERDYVDFGLPDDWPEVTLGMNWLESEAAVDPFDCAFIMAAAASPYSFFVIDRVRPGWWLQVTDLLTGHHFVVVDADISARVRPDDVLLSAILTLDGVSSFLGLAPQSVPRTICDEAHDIPLDYSGTEWLTRTELVGMELDLFTEYRTALDVALARGTGREASRGTPVVLRWLLSTPFHDALEALRPLSESFEDEEVIYTRTCPDGEPMATIVWYERGQTSDPDDWIELGCLYLRTDRLTADLAEPGLGARLVATIAERLGSDATLVEQRNDTPTMTIHTRQSRLLPLLDDVGPEWHAER